MTGHVHEWLTNLYVFPDSAGSYEFDAPYVIEYCGDRICGARQARVIPDEVAEQVARDNGRPVWVSLEHEAAYQAARKAA